MALSDADGAIVERVDYDAYGQPTFFDADGNIMAQSSIGNTILFTGREYDTESGTYYYRARSMHPNMGRFMRYDPLRYVDGMNLYSYVNNMPILMVDPQGKEKSCENGRCKANNGYKSSCNYCGSEKSFLSEVPNFGNEKFNRACFNHDLCYEKKGKSWCDLQFYKDLKESGVGSPLIPWIYSNAVGFGAFGAYGVSFIESIPGAIDTFLKTSFDAGAEIGSFALSVAENAWYSLAGGLGSVVSALDFLKNEEKKNPGTIKTASKGVADYIKRGQASRNPKDPRSGWAGYDPCYYAGVCE